MSSPYIEDSTQLQMAQYPHNGEQNAGYDRYRANPVIGHIDA